MSGNATPLEPKTDPHPTPIPQGPRHPHRRRTWPWILALGLIAVLAVGATRVMAFGGFGHGRAHGHGDLSDDAVVERVDRATAFVLDELEATDEQRAEIEAIVDRVVPELLVLRSEGDSLKEELHAALRAEPVDREAIEALRADLVDLVDRASLTLMNGLLDVQDVLTPEQQAEIREFTDRVHRFHER